MALRWNVWRVVASTGPRATDDFSPHARWHGWGPNVPSCVVSCVAVSSRDSHCMASGMSAGGASPRMSPSTAVDGSSSLWRRFLTTPGDPGAFRSGRFFASPASSHWYLSWRPKAMAAWDPGAPKMRSPASPRPGSRPPSRPRRPSTCTRCTSTSGCAAWSASRPAADASTDTTTMRRAPQALSLDTTGCIVRLVAMTGSKMNATSHSEPPDTGSRE
mmetsp:Transcript_25623/g.87621  ORF Transcript_25623/g.87621 Transcript_25623/m.87621 type:complete len:217 (+) Transcript_25623:1272-1922(+)